MDGDLIDERKRLPEATRRALRPLVALAERRREPLALVGGAVRDLLLGRRQLDLDLLVEGDALEFARAAAVELGGRAVTHARFGTAVVRSAGLRFDLAQPRSERYQRPGALPSVRPASLADDLGRRDFTINAMALRLTGTRAGEVADPHGGRKDLRRRLVRTLHDASFQDDATRILRALRYAGRLRFRLAAQTQALLLRDLGYLDTLSGARLRREFERVAGEERVGEIVRLAQELGVLAAAHPALRAERATLFARLSELPASHRDAAFFCLLLAGASGPEAEAALGRLALTGRQADAVRGFLALAGQERELAQPGLRPSDVCCLLEGCPHAALEALALVTKRRRVAERVDRYLSEWRFVRPRLNGHDLQALGVAPGPRIGVALATLRSARLDGATRTREDEVSLVRRTRAAAGATRG